MPESAAVNPVPAILEFLPYRKNDGTVIRDEITMPETAAHGYACIRVDLRGCGESEGLFDDEYSKQENQDGLDVIAWIAEQAWCDGNVGMVGISWGGFNALQLAALQPPALKAIITQCSTDDRYRDDIHYSGGCLLNDNMDWAAFLWAYAQARSPDPKLVGDNWKSIWLDRLANMPFLASTWLAQQTRSDYWKHGSVCQNYQDIKIPVYAIGGWADGYRNTVFSLLQNLSGPKKGLVGPWAHKYPNIAFPDPKMDYVAESVRWWDKWLKGIDNGIDTEPTLHYYLQNSVTPQTDYSYRPGRWVCEAQWPSPNTHYHTRYLSSDSGLVTAQCDSVAVSIRSPQTVGLDGGRFCVGIRLDMEHPADQRIDDSGSLVFDSEILTQAMPIAGQINTALKLSSDKPQANIIVRVCDIHPDGQVTRITHGVLNLSHRNSHEYPEPLELEKKYAINIPLNHMAYVIPKGHKLRVAISTAYWPLIWPTADHATITIYPSECSISVPLNESPVESNLVPEYTRDVYFDGENIRPTQSSRQVTRDYKTGIYSLQTYEDFGHQFINSAQSEIEFSIRQSLSIHPDDPLSAQNRLNLKVDMGRKGWQTGLEGNYQMTCDIDNFYIKASWKCTHEGEVVFSKDFNEVIKRNFT